MGEGNVGWVMDVGEERYRSCSSGWGEKKRGALEPFRETFSRAAGASVSVIVKLYQGM